MKIKNLLHSYSAKLVAAFIVASFTVTGCSASPTNKMEDDNLTMQKDSVMRKAVGDSIYTILTNAKSVSASLKLKTKDNKTDSIVNVKVAKNDKYVLNFILSAPSYYESNDTVFGKYVPNFTLNFKASKGRSCSANFDFGLRKWNICDASGNEIVKFDLPTSDVLRFANQLFPDCEYFNVLLNSQQK